jgi:DNA polymerase-1
MVRLAPTLADLSPATELLLQVHDELLFELPVSELAPVSARVKEIMEGATNLSVPLVVELKAGPNWRDMVEVRI